MLCHPFSNTQIWLYFYIQFFVTLPIQSRSINKSIQLEKSKLDVCHNKNPIVKSIHFNLHPFTQTLILKIRIYSAKIRAPTDHTSSMELFVQVHRCLPLISYIYHLPSSQGIAIVHIAWVSRKELKQSRKGGESQKKT